MKSIKSHLFQQKHAYIAHQKKQISQVWDNIWCSSTIISSPLFNKSSSNYADLLGRWQLCRALSWAAAPFQSCCNGNSVEMYCLGSICRQHSFITKVISTALTIISTYKSHYCKDQMKNSLPWL